MDSPENTSRPRNHKDRDSTTIITDHNEPDSDEDARPPARKRKSNYLAEDDERPQKKPQAYSFRSAQTKAKHGVPIGVWMLSDEPIPERKHVVYGFFDNNAKNPAFRMRIYPERKDVTEYIGNMRPGTGNWAIKPQNLLPDSHLRSLSEKQLAEYAKLRVLNWREDETPAERKTRDDAAIAGAIAAVAEKAASKSRNNGDSKKQTAPEANDGRNESRNSNAAQRGQSADGPSPSISAQLASGKSMPKSTTKLAENVTTTPAQQLRQVATPQPESTPSGGSSKKKPSDSDILPGEVATPQSESTPSGGSSKKRRRDSNILPHEVATPQSGSTPSGGSSNKKLSDGNILLGWWKKSEAVKKEDKHVVYGVIQANSVFRIKVVQENIRGERFKGNFPTNPGGCWIPYDDVLLMSYLEEEGLLRTEIEEYSRICFTDPEYWEGDQGQAIRKAIQVAKRHVQDMAKQAGMNRLEYDKKRCDQLERTAISREVERQRKKASKGPTADTAETLNSVAAPESSSLGVTPIEDNGNAFDGVGQDSLNTEVERQSKEREIAEMPRETEERNPPALGPSAMKTSNPINAQTTHDADDQEQNEASGDTVRPPKKSRHMEAPGIPKKLARRSMKNSFSRTEYFSRKNQREKASPNSKTDVHMAESSLQTEPIHENRRKSEELSGNFEHSDAARRDPKRKNESLGLQQSTMNGTNEYARPLKRPKSSSALSSLGASEPRLPPALSPLAQSTSVIEDVPSRLPEQDADGPAVTAAAPVAAASVTPSASTMKKYTTIYPSLSLPGAAAAPAATSTASGTSDRSAATPAKPTSETKVVSPGPMLELSGDQIAPVHTTAPVREAVLEARATAHPRISRETSTDPLALATQAMEAYRQPRQETVTMPHQMSTQYKPSTPATRETSQTSLSQSTGDSLASSTTPAVPGTTAPWVVYEPKAVPTRPQVTPTARGNMHPPYLPRFAADMPNTTQPHTSNTAWNAVNRPLRHPSFETSRKSSDAPPVATDTAIPPAIAATYPNPTGEVIGRTPVTPTATPMPDIAGNPRGKSARKIAQAVAAETPGIPSAIPVSAANVSLGLQVPVTSQSGPVRENQIIPDRPAVADLPRSKPVQENPISHVTLVPSQVQQAEKILGIEPGRESLVPLINPVALAIQVVGEAMRIAQPQLTPDSRGAPVRSAVSGKSEIASVLNPEPVNPEPVQKNQFAPDRQSTTSARGAQSAPPARLAHDESRDPRMSMQRYIEEPSKVQAQPVTREQTLTKAHKESAEVHQPLAPSQLSPQPPQAPPQESAQFLSQPQTQLPPQPPQAPPQESAQLLSQPQTKLPPQSPQAPPQESVQLLSQPQTQLPPQPPQAPPQKSAQLLSQHQTQLPPQRLSQTPVRESTELPSQPQTNMRPEEVKIETQPQARPIFIPSQSPPVVPSSDEIVQDSFGDKYSIDVSLSGLFDGLLVGKARQPVVRIDGRRYGKILVLVPKNQSAEVEETADPVFDDNKTEYRKTVGLFQDLFVGVDSEMVSIGKERYIKYIVLEPV